MFDMNLKPIPSQNSQQSSPTYSRLNSPPSVQSAGTTPQIFTAVQSFQGFVYSNEQVAHKTDSFTNVNNFSTIQNLGNSPVEIADTLKKSGYSWTNSESTSLPIFSIGINNQAEQKTGEYAYLMMGSPEKNSMYSVTTFRLRNGDLLTKIEAALTGYDLFTLQMVKVGNNGYQVNTPLAPIEEYIPLDTSLDAVNFVVASIWVGTMNSIGKYQTNFQEKSIEADKFDNSTSSPTLISHNRKKNPIPMGKKPFEWEELEPMCIPHDMGCSGGNLVTLDGKFNFWFPCAGGFSADLFDCCYRHDVGIYCSTSFWDSSAEDLDLIHCMSAKIIAAGLEKMPWGCKWMFGVPFITFFSALSIIGYIVMPIIPYSADKVNYDGRHSSSCLCGGNRPTVCCQPDYGLKSICLDSICKRVNICKAKGTRINNSKCRFENDPLI
jgi:hypothetical protein